MAFYKNACTSIVSTILIIIIWSRVAESTGIGVNWGTISSHRLSPTTVVDLLKDNNIKKVKLFDADPSSLRALMGTGIEVIIGIPNDLLQPISSSTAASDLWVAHNVSRYVGKGGINLKYVFLFFLWVFLIFSKGGFFVFLSWVF